MATDVLVENTQTQQPAESRQEITIDSNKLSNSFFSLEQPEIPITQTKVEEKPSVTDKIEQKTESVKIEVKEEGIPEPKDWLKKEFGIEDAAILKAEREELKKLKEQPASFQFENEESKRMAEAIARGDRKTVMQILDQQERLDSLTKAEVSDDNAEAILKLAIQLKNKDAGLTQSEIDYKFNKEFGIPKEPVRKEDELDEEFDVRKSEWQDKVNDIKINRRMEAKLALPELDKLKTQIVLPDISQTSAQKPLSPEEQDAIKRYDEAYVQSVENSTKNFNGFSVPVKNEVVDFPVSFGISNEDKVALSALMKDFQKGNYNANGLLADLWVNDDKSLKTDKIIEDYYLIRNKEKVLSKLANDSATKAIESYIKGKKNINVGETSVPGTANLTKEDKTEMDLIRDQFFG